MAWLMHLVMLLLGFEPTIPAPTVFSPEQLSAAGDILKPVFAPDGRTAYFCKGSSLASSELHEGRWSEPRPLPFSGRHSDIEPTIAPDGSALVFSSNRPAQPGGAALDGAWDGQAWPGSGGQLWRVARGAKGWGAPERLGPEINEGSSIFAPALTRKGTLYFMKPAEGGGHFQLYRAEPRGKGFKAPQPLPFDDPRYSFEDAAAAPDDSFLVFVSDRPPAASGDLDLFIAFHQGGRWSAPIHLDAPASSPQKEIETSLGPDGHTLYFTSRRLLPGDTGPKGPLRTWTVDLQPWLKGRLAVGG